MKGYYSIGELSEKTGLSVHTLRYYDSIDLLNPDYVDEMTGYRYYDASSFWRAEVIYMFKSLDVPLEHLKAILISEDNQSIRKVLTEKKKEIRSLICHYQQIGKDIDWFLRMIKEMETCDFPEIHEEKKEEYSVIYTENQREERELHLTLQDISLNETAHLASLKRKYGYIIDNRMLQNNVFRRKGEFLNLYTKNYNFTDKTCVYTIPSGNYVCQRVEVKDFLVDMSPMRRYLKEHHLKPKFVLAEEIGLPLFNFKKFDCEIQILVDKSI